VFGRHVAPNVARLRQFADGVSASKQHLHHSQPVRVRQYLEALGRLL
jgi:hypothetical protein